MRFAYVGSVAPFPVILASASPQRREMLLRLGVEFEVEVSGAEEIVHGDPREVVLANALLKARSVARTGSIVTILNA